MECPICKNTFSVVREILTMADRSFYCHHCWSRLISYPNGKGKYLIEEDITGDKWRILKKNYTYSLKNFRKKPQVKRRNSEWKD